MDDAPRLPDTTRLLSHLTRTELDVMWCGRLEPLVKQTLYWVLARECFYQASLLGHEDRMHWWDLRASAALSEMCALLERADAERANH